METIVKNVLVHNKGCNGCKRFNRDVMVTMFTTSEESVTEFNDFFLSTEQAENLVKDLQIVLKINKEDK